MRRSTPIADINMRNIHKREARVAPKNGKWEAFFADAPKERCHGDTPQLALAALRQHAANCAQVSAKPPKRKAESGRKFHFVLLATAFVAVVLATALIMQTTANVGKPSAKMYAHHRMHGHASDYTGDRTP